MFSLIITIISIALVAVLALATLYYGGKSFLQGSAAATASKVANEGQQISGAYSLYQTEEGTVPAFNDLLTKGYLKAIPAQGGVAWRAFDDSSAVVWLPNALNQEACQAVNAKLVGSNGIPSAPVAAWPRHCFGSNGNFSIVWNSTGTSDITATITDAISAGVDTKGTAVPASIAPSTSPADAGSTNTWAVAPASGSTASSGNGNGVAPDITFNRTTFYFDKPEHIFSDLSYITNNGADLVHVKISCATSSGSVYLSDPTWFIDGSGVHVDIRYPYMMDPTRCLRDGVLSNAATFLYDDGSTRISPLVVKVID